MPRRICENCKRTYLARCDNKGRFCSLPCYWKGKVGEKQTPETIKKRTSWAKGYKWRKETIEKRSKSLTGKKRTGQAYQNILDGIAKGYGYPSYKEMPLEERKDWRGTGWRKVSKAIIERDGHICAWCGGKDRLQVHHINPWRVSHDNSPENLITLCIHCHQSLKGKEKSHLFEVAFSHTKRN